ncbi:MAG: hypothetical protein J5852_00785 [Clostridia bacterium]|nr:hypothetical protein [Clostridia bacterium]
MKLRLFNTEIYISFLFAATVAFMLATDRTGMMLPTLFAVLIHESGHLFSMWAGDCAPKEIRLILASVQIIEGFPRSDALRVGIILGGPLANIAVGGAVFINYYLTGSSVSLRFALLNAVLALFNLLPVSGLDGGRLLCLILCRKKDLYSALRIVKNVSIVLAAAVFFFGVVLGLNGKLNISVFITALYLAVCTLIKM